MYTIKLMNEFLHGPIWVYDENGIVRRKYPLIDNDEELSDLNEKARILYDSFYSFDGESACTFDEEGYKKSHEKMVIIVGKIIEKLNKINNNDFVIENHIF